MIGTTSSRALISPEDQVRDSRESRLHRRAILRLAMAYGQAGYDVKAGHVDRFDYPCKYNFMKPDIVAERDGDKIIVEVETESTVGTDSDRKQRKVFSEWAKEGENRDFRRETVVTSIAELRNSPDRFK